MTEQLQPHEPNRRDDLRDPDAELAKHHDVFICYKRDDADIRDLVIEALQVEGYSVLWDAKLQSREWRPQLASKIRTSKLVVAIWSQNAADRPDEVRDEISQARGLDKLVAIKTDAAPPIDLFDEQNFMAFDGWADEARRAEQLGAIVAEVKHRVANPTYQVVPTGQRPDRRTLIAQPDLGDIPEAPPKLIGRDAELALLRNAWASNAPNKINAVVLHALGGAGKSALLRTFVDEMLAAGGGGAERIYGWSAYSQGSGEQKRADADGFISKALGDFGWQGELPKDPVERARQLAKLIHKYRTLLLLDGLEPLQDPPHLNKGRFKDRGLAELVRRLALDNPGLVVLTSRQEVPELERAGRLVVNHPLDELSPAAGADLLVDLGVTGRRRELEDAVREVEGHALSVTLLGTYLAEVCDGDIRHRDQFDFNVALSADEQLEFDVDKTVKYAKRAEKVMLGYLEQFDKLATDGATVGLGGPERALLHLLGLFDRPADGAAVDKLLEHHIPGLTDDLLFERIEKTTGWLFKKQRVELEPVSKAKRDARLREAKKRLRKLRLLSAAAKDDPRGLDAHPVVRAYFAKRLEDTAPEAAKAAHDLLYRHYAAATPDLPDTLDEMQPLFHAIAHGVKAGYKEEALDIYIQRVRQFNQGGVAKGFLVSGALGPILTALSRFYAKPYQTLLPDWADPYAAFILNESAAVLKSLGRLREALVPRQEAVELHSREADWANAANTANSLCQELLLAGDVRKALRAGESSLEYARRSGDQTLEHWCISDLANANAQSGDFQRASELLDRIDFHGIWFGFTGYKFGDLQIARHDYSGALERGMKQLKASTQNYGITSTNLSIALDKLLIGRALDALGDRHAAPSLDAAVAGLRKAGRTDYLPQALLARAAHLRRRAAAAGEAGLIAAIHTDLDEVEDIAGDEMRLYLTDLALERARLALDVPEAVRTETESAATQTTLAETLITETGYHRRDAELADLKARLSER